MGCVRGSIGEGMVTGVVGCQRCLFLHMFPHGEGNKVPVPSLLAMAPATAPGPKRHHQHQHPPTWQW